MHLGSLWQVEVAGEVVGTIRVRGYDMPLTFGEFDATPQFESVSQLFAEELQLLNADRMDAWQVAYQRILSLGLRLRAADRGKVVEEVLLHIDGREAWFRC